MPAPTPALLSKKQSQESRSGREPEGSPARFRLEVESPLLVHYTGSKLQRDRTHRRLSGNNGTWLIVGADGLPKNIKAQRPVGLGLDDEAVKAVESWKFAPAMKAGSPVPVMINVEVNF